MTAALGDSTSYRTQLGIIVALDYARYCEGEMSKLDEALKAISSDDGTIEKYRHRIESRKCG